MWFGWSVVFAAWLAYGSITYARVKAVPGRRRLMNRLLGGQCIAGALLPRLLGVSPFRLSPQAAVNARWFGNTLSGCSASPRCTAASQSSVLATAAKPVCMTTVNTRWISSAVAAPIALR